MYRKILIALFALFVSLILAGAAAAQVELDPKAIGVLVSYGPRCWEPPCTYWGSGLNWQEPEKKPDKYRVQWTTKNWRSWKKPNTNTRGNAFVTDNRYNLGGQVRVPYGVTLRVRIRAIYKGEKNGPWRCCLELGYGDD